MKKDEVLVKVKEITADNLGFDITDLENNNKLVDDLGCDSLDCIELLMEFEREFDISISISNEEAENVKTISDCACLIYPKLA